jgi:hypothetical protein
MEVPNHDRPVKIINSVWLKSQLTQDKEERVRITTPSHYVASHFGERLK